MPEGYLYSNKALLALFIPLLIEYGLEFFMGFAVDERLRNFDKKVITKLCFYCMFIIHYSILFASEHFIRLIPQDVK